MSTFRRMAAAIREETAALKSTAEWVRVERAHRCTNCNRMVEVTWRWYSTPTTSTLALCEPCVERLLKEER